MARLVGLIAVLALVAVACNDAAPPPTITVPSEPPRTSVSVPSTSTSTRDAPATSTTTRQTTSSTTTPIGQVVLDLEVVASGFTQPVLVTAPPGDARLFVVDQPGVIWVIDGADPRVYLDIRDRVAFRGERGLLGMAFDPAFATTGRFFVDYTDRGGDTVVASFTAEPTSDEADPGSQVVLLTIDQPASNHNGGNLVIGPDGNLWIGMGDGGGADDVFGHGQRVTSLLAALLRITPTDGGYEIPERSGAITTEGAPEVWAVGLRNPWRFAFDGDLLYIADVGQDRLEEIDVIDVRAVDEDPRECLGCVALPNFGWPIQEGSECFSSSPCDPAGLVQPIFEYTHSEGCSITGGFVYRGEAIPALRGSYVYGDYCNGWIRSLRYDPATGDVADSIEWFGAGTVPQLTSFGQDATGELYVMSAEGTVWRIVEAG